MTQQPVQPYPQQYAQPPAQPQQYPPPAASPQQPYYPPQPPAQPMAQQPQYVQSQQPYAPQYGQPQYGQPAAPPQVPLANGGLDEFYSQPSLGGGPGVSWKGKPDGFTVQGVVPRDVGDGDVSQEVGAPNTAEAGRPQFYRDGRPKFVMAIPLQVAPSQEFPEGEARLYVRGQLRDELGRAMQEAGAAGAPVANSTVTVTLVQRKQGRGAIPQNIFHVTYTPPGGQPPAVQQPVQQYAQPQQVQQPAAPPQWVQPQPQTQAAPPPQTQPVQQPVPQQVQQPTAPPVQQTQAAPPPVPQGAPQQPVQQPAPGAPTGLTPEQAELFAKLTGQPAA